MTNSKSKTELENLISKDDKLVIIDVRSNEEFNQQHLPKAINIPLDQLEAESKQFSPNTLYVTVCGKGGGRSEQAAQLLIQNGFKAYFLEDGTLGWFDE
jgi:rhodanese-related sulfurtransferase